MRLLLFALIAGVAPAALALEAYKPPRTADGHPDFSGTWSTSFMTLLERPPFFKTLVLTDSIQPTEAVKVARNIRVISVASLLGEAIHRTALEETLRDLQDLRQMVARE